jgi:hypothetical protein
VGRLARCGRFVSKRSWGGRVVPAKEIEVDEARPSWVPVLQPERAASGQDPVRIASSLTRDPSFMSASIGVEIHAQPLGCVVRDMR